MTRAIRIWLLVVEAFVAVTAVAGGSALIVGTIIGDESGLLIPDPRYLDGSPFDSYLLPGALLTVIVGGVHAAAVVLVARRSRWAVPATVVAGFGLHIWVFVELVVIPFSPLQATYFAAALAEVGLALLGLGLLRRATRSTPSAASWAASGTIRTP